MADKNAIDDEDVVVIMTDEEGNEYKYLEEMIIPVGDEKFALLVGIHEDEEHEDYHCDCGCEEEEDVIIAKIVLNEDGEEEYIEPTDEEFEAVQEAYNTLVDEAEQE